MNVQTDSSPGVVPKADASSASTKRLTSVDALRGFDMFWIIGAEALVAALDRMSRTGEKGNGFIGFLAYQLGHSPWEGFRFYDLIFPLFVFIAGVSLVFSVGKTIQQEGRPVALKRILRRGVLLYALGIFYYGGLSNVWAGMRMTGVLNRIALCYLFAGIIFCFCNLRTMVAICVGLLLGYWALMSFFPMRDIQLEQNAIQQIALQRGLPFELTSAYTDKTEARVEQLRLAKPIYYGATNYVTGHFEKGRNLSDHFDFLYLPGFKLDTFFDPEGLLSNLPAIGTCLLGVFAGLLLSNTSLRGNQKVIYLFIGGLVMVTAGWIWNLQFPVIKKIWTSSFVLVAGGYSACLIGLFYWIVDVKGFQKWCQPFVWMGMNSITIYMTANILGGFGGLSRRFIGGDIRALLESHVSGSGDLAMALVDLGLAFWFVHFLYRRKIFLRL